MRIQHPRRPSGFIQNFIIPGIVLLGVVISGLLALTGPAVSGVRGDAAAMSAGIVLVQGSRLHTALLRAVGDGSIAPDTIGLMDIPAADVQAAPDAALTAPAAWLYVQRSYQVKNAQVAPADIGTSAPDDVLYLPNITAAACASINSRLYGVSSFAGNYAPGGTFILGQEIQGPTVAPAWQIAVREGCVAVAGSTTAFVYYKIVGEH